MTLSLSAALSVASLFVLRIRGERVPVPLWPIRGRVSGINDWIDRNGSQDPANPSLLFHWGYRCRPLSLQRPELLQAISTSVAMHRLLNSSIHSAQSR